MLRFFSSLGLGVALSAAMLGNALADRIRNPVAVFSGLDKITGRIIAFEVNIDETVQFGSLQITPRICWTRPATEQPQTTSFVEVDEVGLSNDYRRIFSGWMYAASPGLHGVEHAIYDVWATDCKGGTTIIAEPREPSAADVPAEIRRERATPTPRAQPRPAAQPADGRIDVRPPQGVPVAPQQPSQRFFPTTPQPGRGVLLERGTGSDR
ncbi:MAG: DUF2155 domain-containing protein [Bosea sp. (in: a-proteobacteria)]